MVPWQNKGLRLIREERYDEAIACFEKGYKYLERHPRIDRYRFIVMLSCSAFSYREIALCNVAFCYGQTGESETAFLIFGEILEQYPNNVIARTNLNLLKPFMEKIWASFRDSQTLYYSTYNTNPFRYSPSG